MSFGTEIAANMQRLLQLINEFQGGLGDGVQTALGQIQPQLVQFAQPDIGDQGVDHDKHCRGTPLPVAMS